MTASLDVQIAAIKREIALRNSAYAKFVQNGSMTQERATAEIAAMTAALHTVMAVKRLRATMLENVVPPRELEGVLKWQHYSECSGTGESLVRDGPWTTARPDPKETPE